MANIKLSFLGTKESKTNNVELQCFRNANENQITIVIEDTDLDHHYNQQHISIDIPTAIKLSKTLRTEINKIKTL